MNETKPEVYTVPEVGKLLGINRNLAYEMARQGQIPTIKLGRRLVDMDIYQPGFDREWVKRFKAMLKAPRLMVGARLDWDGQV